MTALRASLPAFGLFVICAASADRAPATREIVIETASLTTPQGEVVPYERGTLYVAENRRDPTSRRIGVGFARFRSTAPTGAPPTFHLPGGPGQTFLEWLDPQSPRYARQLRDIALYRQIGDVVFVDQRGFSTRGDMLEFKHRTLPLRLDRPGSIGEETDAAIVVARAAVAEMSRKGVDLRGYTIIECAGDVNDLRSALGYAQITLIGQSFGSQWSAAVMRIYPHTVARAVLSGVEPLDYAYDMPAHVYAAVQRRWREAEKDERLRPWLPAGGLSGAAQSIVQRLERSPVQVKLDDATIVLGADDFRRDFLELTEPAALLALYHGRYEQWAQSVLNKRRPHDSEEIVIAWTIDSSLGVTRGREQLLRNDPALPLLGTWNFNSLIATSDIWPSEDVGDELRTEVVNRIPTLFVQGDWDLWTPIENLLHVTPHYVNSRTLIVERGMHSAFADVRAQLPDATAAIMDFVRTGSTANLPARVAVSAPGAALPDFPAPERRQ